MIRFNKQYSLVIYVILNLTTVIYGFGTDLLAEEQIGEDAGQERFFIFLPSSSLNISQLAGAAALAAAALLPLLGIAALCLLLWAILNQQTTGFAHSGYGSSYSSSYRSFNDNVDRWDQLSILDWISIFQETYANYSPNSLDCQKRFICEVHQNAGWFGPPAKTFIEYFDYFRYVEVLSLPDNLKDLVGELMDAAIIGKDYLMDCRDSFKECKFSLKEMVYKYRYGRNTKKQEKLNAI